MKATDELRKRQVLIQLAEKKARISNVTPSKISIGVEEFNARKRLSRFRANVAGISASLLLVIMGVFFFMTPTGHAVANDILNFFSQTPSNERPLTIVVEHENELPTSIANEQDPMELTAAPQTIVNDDFVNDLTVNRAEEMAGFTLFSDKAIPEGYELNDVIFNRKTVAVTRQYLWNGKSGTEAIVLTQQLIPEELPIGSNATVEHLQIGSVWVEGVQGGWLEPAGSNVELWEAGSPMFTYRWRQEGYTFTMQFVYNEVTDPGYIPEQNRLKLIGLLTGTESTIPVRWNLNNLTISEVKEVAEFPALIPAASLKGLVFDHAVYEVDTPRLIMVYAPATVQVRMNIFEIPIELSGDKNESSGLPADAIQNVKVGTYPAVFQRGAMVNGVYDPYFSVSLVWKTETTFVNITVFSMDSTKLPPINLEDLIAFAEGMQ